MSKQPENLYQRGGVWWIRYSVNGRKVRRSLKTTKVREAKRLRDEIIGKRAAGDQVREAFGLVAAVDSGTPVPTVAEVATAFLRKIEARGGLRAKTRQLVSAHVNNWIVPILGHQRVNAVGEEEIDSFLGTLRTSKKKKGKGKLGAHQIRDIYKTARRLFRYAERRGHVAFNPFDKVPKSDRPKRPKAKVDYLEIDEMNRLLEKLGDHPLRDMAYLAFNTGLRWGEVCGLAWDDVDLDSNPPHITPRRSFRGPLKNEASAATIEIRADLAAEMRLWKVAASTPWVFPNRRGELRREMTRHERKRLHTAAESARVTKHVTPHIFRHSFGTWLYAATGDVLKVKRAMRHASVKTTMLIYVKDTGASLADALESMPAINRPGRLQTVG